MGAEAPFFIYSFKSKRNLKRLQKTLALIFKGSYTLNIDIEKSYKITNKGEEYEIKRCSANREWKKFIESKR